MIQRTKEGEAEMQAIASGEAPAAKDTALPGNESAKGVEIQAVEERRRLKRRGRDVLTLDDFTDADIAALEKSRAPAETAAFDHEVSVDR